MYNNCIKRVCLWTHKVTIDDDTKRSGHFFTVPTRSWLYGHWPDNLRSFRSIFSSSSFPLFHPALPRFWNPCTWLVSRSRETVPHVVVRDVGVGNGGHCRLPQGRPQIGDSVCYFWYLLPTNSVTRPGNRDNPWIGTINRLLARPVVRSHPCDSSFSRPDTEHPTVTERPSPQSHVDDHSHYCCCYFCCRSYNFCSDDFSIILAVDPVSNNRVLLLIF